MCRKEPLTAAFNKYNAVQDQIEDLLLEDTADLQDTEIRDEIEEMYFIALALIQEKINEDSMLTSADQTLHMAPQVAANRLPAVKLPNVEISHFSGTQSEWQSFSQLFDALITKHPSLTDIQRLIYLKSYLKGEPLKLIESLQVINENFKIALDVLTKRYENKNCIVNSHFSSLLETAPITKCTAHVLREFVTNCRKNLDCLKNLNLTHEQLLELLLTYLLQQKLDFGTRKSFEQERDVTALPTLTEFFAFLEKKCIALENLSSSGLRPQKRTDRATLRTNLTAYPEKELIQVPDNRLSFWQQCSKMQQLFWKRWSVEYLNRLQNRSSGFSRRTI